MYRTMVLAVVLVAAGLLAWTVPNAAWAADPPSDRVLVMYFHRTQRCPTCLRMGSYTEEAIRGGAFADELKQGKVAFHFIDFQDQRNAAISKGYGVAGPTLIVAKVVGNKVAAYQNLKEMWSKSVNRPDFVDYVQSNVKAYLK